VVQSEQSWRHSRCRVRQRGRGLYICCIQALAPGSQTDTNVPHTYADPAGDYTISTGGCCTISSLNNANAESWNILSKVDLGADDESAVSTIPAVVTLAPGAVRTFNVPAGDADGETLHYRLSTPAES